MYNELSKEYERVFEPVVYIYIHAYIYTCKITGKARRAYLYMDELYNKRRDLWSH